MTVARFNPIEKSFKTTENGMSHKRTTITSTSTKHNDLGTFTAIEESNKTPPEVLQRGCVCLNLS